MQARLASDHYPMIIMSYVNTPGNLGISVSQDATDSGSRPLSTQFGSRQRCISPIISVGSSFIRTFQAIWHATCFGESHGNVSIAFPQMVRGGKSSRNW